MIKDKPVMTEVAKDLLARKHYLESQKTPVDWLPEFAWIWNQAVMCRSSLAFAGTQGM